MSEFGHILMAMEPRALDELGRRAELGMRFGLPENAQPRAMIGCDDGGGYKPYTMEANVAVIHIDGPVMWSASLMDQIFCGVIPTGLLIGALRAAAADPAVAAAVLDVHCPGGSVPGMDDLTVALDEFRAAKPLYAISHDLMTSAAQWIGALCDECVATPTAMLGSIGVRLPSLIDASKAFAEQGLKLNQFVSAPAKGLGEIGAPVKPEDAAFLQRMTDRIMDDFAQAVARGRGLTVAAVKAMKAEIFVAADAKSRGLIDEVVPYAQYIERKVKDHSGASFTPATPVRRGSTTQEEPTPEPDEGPEAQEHAMSDETKKPVKPAPAVTVTATPSAAAVEAKAPAAEAKAPAAESRTGTPATFGELNAAFGSKPGGAELIVEAQAKGLTLLDAYGAYTAKLEASIALALTEPKKPAAPAAVEPVATFTPSVQAVGAPDGEPADFAQAVAKVMKEEATQLKGKPRAQAEALATAHAARAYPALHAKWRESNFPALKIA